MLLPKTVRPLVGNRAVKLLALGLFASPLAFTAACSSDSQSGATSTSTSTSTSATGTGGGPEGSGGATSATSSASAGGAGGEGGSDPGPQVDSSDPQLYSITFKPNDADPEATTKLANQPAYLDTTVPSRGLLVVYLHGADTPATTAARPPTRKCSPSSAFTSSALLHSAITGSTSAATTSKAADSRPSTASIITPFIDITPPTASRRASSRASLYLQAKNPEGDWKYFSTATSPAGRRSSSPASPTAPAPRA